MIKLANWSFTASSSNPYLAPERAGLSAQGNVTGHGSFIDGDHVVTSQIQDIQGREFSTFSGSKYVLVGDPNPRYVAFLESIGWELDPNDPVSFLRTHAAGE